jgi:hypothetical protein
MRQNFEIKITGRRECEVCEDAMKALGRFLPRKFIVMAKNEAQAYDFMKTLDRSNGVYVSEAEQLHGWRDPTVVQIGHFEDADNYVEIMTGLQTRGRITWVTVTDWR